MKQPKIELKNIKHSAFASEETHCYQATLYVDGKKFATVRNDGHGGCDMVDPLGKVTHEDIRKLDATIKKTFPKITDLIPGKELDTDLECLCSELVNAFLSKKEYKKILRRVSYIKDGSIYQMPAKVKPTKENLAEIKRVAPWAKGITFLNELPEEEAFELLRKTA